MLILHYRSLKNILYQDGHSRAICKPYFNYRDEISELHGVLLKGHSAVIVASSKQHEMRKLLHTGHPGIVNMKMKARNVILAWNESLFLNLKTSFTAAVPANKAVTSSNKEPLISHEVPAAVWTKVGKDLFTLYNKDYLIITDYTSKFFYPPLLPSKTSPTVISCTKSTFAKFGIPKKVMFDNVPEFASSEYKQFDKDWDFDHDTSSLEYPQSNRFIERTIQAVKSSLKKALSNNEDPYLAILAL